MLTKISIEFVVLAEAILAGENEGDWARLVIINILLKFGWL